MTYPRFFGAATLGPIYLFLARLRAPCTWSDEEPKKWHACDLLMTFEDYCKKKQHFGANLTILQSFKQRHFFADLPAATVRTSPEMPQAIPYTKQAYPNPKPCHSVNTSTLLPKTTETNDIYTP